MNVRGISEHAHSKRLDFSRRQFTRTVGGAAVAGATIASGILTAQGPKGDTFTPVPIPGGTPVLGGAFHVFGPGIIDPVDAEPSSITNFNGFVGLAFISGMVTRTDTSTGESLRLPFVNNDMRFMIGTFRGSDGRVHQGAFAFI
jgi:hypothetical protein